MIAIEVYDVLHLVMSVIISCGRQMLKGNSDTGESHQPYTTEAQRRRSGTYSKMLWNNGTVLSLRVENIKLL